MECVGMGLGHEGFAVTSDSLAHSADGEAKLPASPTAPNDVAALSPRSGGNCINHSTWKRSPQPQLVSNERGFLYKQILPGKSQLNSPSGKSINKPRRRNLDLIKDGCSEENNDHIILALEMPDDPKLLRISSGNKYSVSNGIHLLPLKPPHFIMAVLLPKSSAFGNGSSYKHSNYWKNEVTNKELQSESGNKTIKISLGQMLETLNKNLGYAHNEEQTGLLLQSKNRLVKRDIYNTNTARYQPGAYSFYKDYIPSFDTDFSRVNSPYSSRSTRQYFPGTDNFSTSRQDQRFIPLHEEETDHLRLLRIPLFRESRSSKEVENHCQSDDIGDCLTEDLHPQSCFCAVVCPVNSQKCHRFHRLVLDAYKDKSKSQHVSNNVVEVSDYLRKHEATKHTENVRRFNHGEKVKNIKYDQRRPQQNDLYFDRDHSDSRGTYNEKCRSNLLKVLRDFKSRSDSGDVISTNSADAWKTKYTNSYTDENTLAKTRKFHEKIKHIREPQDTYSIVKRNDESWNNVEINKNTVEGEFDSSTHNLNYEDENIRLISERNSGDEFNVAEFDENNTNKYVLISDSNESRKEYTHDAYSDINLPVSGNLDKRIEDHTDENTFFTSNDNSCEDAKFEHADKHSSENYKFSGGTKYVLNEKPNTYYSSEYLQSHSSSQINEDMQKSMHDSGEAYILDENRGTINVNDQAGIGSGSMKTLSSTSDKEVFVDAVRTNMDGKFYKARDIKDVLKEHANEKNNICSANNNNNIAQKGLSGTPHKYINDHCRECIEDGVQTIVNENKTTKDTKEQEYRSKYDDGSETVVVDEASITESNKLFGENIKHPIVYEKIQGFDEFYSLNDTTGNKSLIRESDDFIPSSGEEYNHHSLTEHGYLKKQMNENYTSHLKYMGKASSSAIVGQSVEYMPQKDSLKEVHNKGQSEKSQELYGVSSALIVTEQSVQSNPLDEGLHQDKQEVLVEFESNKNATPKEASTSTHKGILESGRYNNFPNEDNSEVILTHKTLKDSRDRSNVQLANKNIYNIFQSNESRYTDPHNSSLKFNSLHYDSVEKGMSQANSKEETIQESHQSSENFVHSSSMKLNFPNKFDDSRSVQDLETPEHTQASAVHSEEQQIVPLPENEKQGKVSIFAADIDRVVHKVSNLSDVSISHLFGTSKESNHENEFHLVSSSENNESSIHQEKFNEASLGIEDAHGLFTFKGAQKSKEESQIAHGEVKQYEHNENENMFTGSTTEFDIFTSRPTDGDNGKEIISAYSKFDGHKQHVSKKYEKMQFSKNYDGSAKRVSVGSESLPSFGIIDESQKVGSYMSDQDDESDINLKHFNRGVPVEPTLECHAEQVMVREQKSDVSETKPLHSFRHYPHSVPSEFAQHAGFEKINMVNNARSQGNTFSRKEHGLYANKFDDKYYQTSNSISSYGRDMKIDRPPVVQASVRYRPRPQEIAQQSNYHIYDDASISHDTARGRDFKQYFPFTSHNSRTANSQHDSSVFSTLADNERLQAQQNSAMRNGKRFNRYDTLHTSVLHRVPVIMPWKNTNFNGKDIKNSILNKKYAKNINKLRKFNRDEISNDLLIKFVPSESLSRKTPLARFTENEDYTYSEEAPVFSVIPKDSIDIGSGNSRYFPVKHRDFFPVSRKPCCDGFPEISKKVKEARVLPWDHPKPHGTGCWACSRSSNELLNFERKIHPSG